MGEVYRADDRKTAWQELEGDRLFEFEDPARSDEGRDEPELKLRVGTWSWLPSDIGGMTATPQDRTSRRC